MTLLDEQALHTTNSKEKKVNGYIFDIQRFSIHDGPGIRTTVFLKGCPLHCKWCCNPESISPDPVLFVNPELCVKCGLCVDVCPNRASFIGSVNRNLCKGCGKCTKVCFAEAKSMKGKKVAVNDVIKEIIKDKSFYLRTNGGVTFSGGEPLVQIDFLEQLIISSKENGLNIAVDTCGYAPWERFEKISKDVDLFLYDIKSTNNDKHFKYTGVKCDRILRNFKRLSKITNNIIVRVPVIPNFNNDRQSLEDIIRFVEKTDIMEIDFLPYHQLASNKYDFMDREYWNPGVEKIKKSEVESYLSDITTNIKLQIGG